MIGIFSITLGQQASAVVVEPNIGVGLIYTDNLRLAIEGNEESDIATQIKPGLKVELETNRINFNLDGSLQFIYFKDASESNATFANGDSVLDFILIPEHLFLDTSASINQTPIDPAEPLPTSNIPITSNRADRRLLQAQPRWESRLFNNELKLAYTIGKIDYDDPTLQGVMFQVVDSSFGYQPEDRGIGWSLQHNYAGYEYDLTGKSQYQTLAGNIEFAFGRGFALTSMYGLESDFLDYSSAEMTENMWSLGFSMVGEDLELTANAGERSYGSTLYFNFRWNLTDSGFFQMTYSEYPATTESLARQNNRPIDPDIPSPPPIIDTPGTANAFINRRYQATFKQQFSKNSMTMTAYADAQTDYITQDGSLPPADRDQFGITVNWTYKLSGKTQLTALGVMASQELLAESARSEFYTLKLSLDYRLGDRTSLNFWLTRTQRTGEVTGVTDYIENQAGFMLDRSF